MENTGLPGPAWLSGKKKAIAKLGILPLFVSGRKNPDRMKPLLQETYQLPSIIFPLTCFVSFLVSPTFAKRPASK